MKTELDIPNMSILDSVTEQLGATKDYEGYDTEILMLINSALSKLTHIGVGPPEGFYICGSSSTWSEFLDPGESLFMAYEYVYLDVKLVFDPPANGTLVEVFTSRRNELASRLEMLGD